MNDLISIIVPVYNTERYLPKCIDSILVQKHENIELILIDDGSKDQSGNICDEYAAKDNRITVIHKENAGQGIARNKALDIARGEYLGFVDSDDYIDPEMFSSLYEAMLEHETDMAFCGVVNDHVFKKKICPKMDKEKIYAKNELFISYLTEPYVRGILCNKLYKAELFRDMRFSSLRAREDAELLYKIYGRCEKSVYVPKALYTQLIRPGSTEQSAFNDSKLYSITIFENLGKYIRENLPEICAYAELLKARGIGDALSQIAASENAEEYESTYDDLLVQLKNELNEHQVHDPVNEQLYAHLLGIVNNQKAFLRSRHKALWKSRILKIVKKILNG